MLCYFLIENRMQNIALSDYAKMCNNRSLDNTKFGYLLFEMQYNLKINAKIYSFIKQCLRNLQFIKTFHETYQSAVVKFICSEKATTFFEISTVDLTVTT